MKRNLLLVSLFISLSSYAQTTFQVGNVVYSTTSPQTVETTAFKSKETQVVIPQTVNYDGNTYTVTAIGKESFSWSSLQSVTLPETIDSIKERAFWYTDLAQVTLPSALKYIGVRSFSSCKMRQISIPANVVKIDNAAFFSCANLESVTFYNGLREIGESAFYHLPKLKTVELPATVVSIGKTAFARSEQLSSLTLPKALKRLGDGAFMDSPKLKTVVLPHGLVHLGDEAFMKCSALESITIPSTLEYWGISAIAATTVKNIVLEGKSNMFVLENGCLYNANKTLLYAIPMRGLQTLNIPEGVIGVNGGAAWGAEITEVSFPSTLLAIDKYAFESSNITQLNLPNSLTFIGEQAFADTKITTLTLPESVTYVDDGAFASCRDLAKVVLPSSIKRIYNHAFSRCNSLKTVQCLGSKAPQIMLVGEDYDDPFYQIASSPTLIVPKGRAEAYKNEGWNSPFTITEDEHGVLIPLSFNPESGKEVNGNIPLSFAISFDKAVRIENNQPSVKLCKEREEYPNIFTPDSEWNVSLSDGNKKVTVWASDYDGFTQQYSFTEKLPYYIIIPSGIVKDAEGNANERIVIVLQGGVSTGIEVAKVTHVAAKVVRIYNEQGVVLPALSKGLNIVEYSNGAKEKVFIK